MAKFFKRLNGVKKEGAMITVQLITLTMPVKEIYDNIFVEWKRGDVTMLTKEKPLLTP